jgi:hypothetical protein
VAFELLTEVPSLLKEGHFVFFDGGWPQGTGKDQKWYQVQRAQQIKLDIPRIVTAGSSIDLDFAAPSGGGIGDTNLSLLPTNVDTLYEMLVGLKGLPFVYPMYNNSYYQKLEVTNVAPDTGDRNLRYLGFYDEQDSPFEAPRLREHVVKDQQPPVLRVYNDQTLDEVLIIRFIINRCRLVLATQRSEEVRRVARVAKYHQWFIY